jgi:predicted nucleic acid-binding protein
MSEPGPVLDTVALRVMAFAHPTGLDILLAALAVPLVRCPAEVYNRDEAVYPLSQADQDLSELARGLRFAQRQVAARSAADAARYQAWLANAAQLAAHLSRGTLVVDPLQVAELPERERLQENHGIGRGEAAGLVLALRQRALVVFVSSDEHACRVAQALGIRFLTLVDVLAAWLDRVQPTAAQFEALVDGMRQARFALPPEAAQDLRRRLVT